MIGLLGLTPIAHRSWRGIDFSLMEVPFTLRYQLAFDAKLTSAVLDVFIRRVFTGLRRAAAREGIADGQCGAITNQERASLPRNARGTRPRADRLQHVADLRPEASQD